MNDEELIQHVEEKLEGKRPFVIRTGTWVKDKKNRVGRVLRVGIHKGRDWALVEFTNHKREGGESVAMKRTRSIWCSDLRST